MDDRQTQIKEGAGLEESRVNQDFVDFLRKWSQPVLLLIVIISAAWFAWQRWTAYTVGRTNDAFAEYEAVANAPDPLPASLRAIAEAYADVGSIAPLAQLRLGDVHMTAVRRGLEPGAALDPFGNPENDADVLDDGAKDDHLGRAQTAYRAAIDAASGDPSKAVMVVSGHFGLAAVAEARGDADAARAEYERAATIARDAGLTGLPAVAEERMTTLASLPTDTTLPSRNDLPVLPGFPAPDLPAADEPIGDEGDDGVAEAGAAEDAAPDVPADTSSDTAADAPADD
ncbi:MAG: hypothetical protein AAF297_07490 [Planctomycetota bacterium]